MVASYINDLTIARALYDDGHYSECVTEVDRVLGDGPDDETRLRGLLLKASALWDLDNRAECLHLVSEAGPLIDNAPEHLRGKFYGQRALLYRNAKDYNGALMNYTEARFWSIAAGDRECEARVRNNLARVYSDLGRIDDAIVEVDAAIKIAKSLNETILAGRFLDMKAQVCRDHKRYEESLVASDEAIGLLGDHPSAAEAKATHTLALEAAALNYLSESDPVERCRLRRVIINGLSSPLSPEIIREALRRTDGQIVKAAQMLNVKYPSLIKAINKYGLHRAPKAPRRRSIIFSK